MYKGIIKVHSVSASQLAFIQLLTLAVLRSSCNFVTLGSASKQNAFKFSFFLLLMSSPVASFIPLAKALTSAASKSRDTKGGNKQFINKWENNKNKGFDAWKQHGRNISSRHPLPNNKQRNKQQ